MQLAATCALLAACVSLAIASTPVKWSKVYTTWAFGGPVAHLLKSGFYSLPLTQADAQKQRWVEAKAEEFVTVWCMANDPRVCVLYDQQGNLAGLQVMFPVEDLANTPYDWTKHDLFFAETLFGQKLAGGRVYVVPQETLRAGGRASVGADDEVAQGLWLAKGDTQVNVPRDTDELPALGWSRENCFINMGRHYYYNVTPTMDCQDFEPVFLLADNRKDFTFGFGFQTFGDISKVDRAWQEPVPSRVIKPTVPTSPDCLVEWADKYGVLSVHFWFSDSPPPYLYFC